MKRGFTLVELLVVIGILSLLSATLILYSRAGERQITVFRDQARVISSLTRAKSLAVATFGQSGVPCGYGVSFAAPRTFLIFKDVAADCQSTDNRYSGPAELVEEFQLDANLMFEALTLSDVIFIPPEPKIIITPAQEQAVITIMTNDGGSSATIKINNAGQIST